MGNSFGTLSIYLNSKHKAGSQAGFHWLVEPIRSSDWTIWKPEQDTLLNTSIRGLNDVPFQHSKGTFPITSTSGQLHNRKCPTGSSWWKLKDILDWKFFQADIKTDDLKEWKDTNIVFVYQRGNYYQTSLALDDIRLRPGACRMIPFAPPKRDAIRATTKPIVITTPEPAKPGGKSIWYSCKSCGTTCIFSNQDTVIHASSNGNCWTSSWSWIETSMDCAPSGNWLILKKAAPTVVSYDWSTVLQCYKAIHKPMKAGKIYQNRSWKYLAKNASIFKRKVHSRTRQNVHRWNESFFKRSWNMLCKCFV